MIGQIARTRLANMPRCGEDQRGPFVLQASGAKFWPLDPRPGDFVLSDITLALSRMPRWTGQTDESREPLSVAEHSMLVASHCPPALRLCGLLHEASEAYMHDIPRPFKTMLPMYLAFEHNVMLAAAEQFGFPWPMPLAVAAADDMVLGGEARDLTAWGLLGNWEEWRQQHDVEPIGELAEPLGWRAARRLFSAAVQVEMERGRRVG